MKSGESSLTNESENSLEGIQRVKDRSTSQMKRPEKAMKHCFQIYSRNFLITRDIMNFSRMRIYLTDYKIIS